MLRIVATVVLSLSSTNASLRFESLRYPITCETESLGPKLLAGESSLETERKRSSSGFIMQVLFDMKPINLLSFESHAGHFFGEDSTLVSSRFRRDQMQSCDKL